VARDTGDDRALLDEVAVRRTLERYMRANDDKDLDRILELFAPDAVYRVAGGQFVGHEKIAAFLRSLGFEAMRPRWTAADRLLVMPRLAHLLSNPVIDVDGDDARAESDFAVLDRDERGHGRIVLLGRYRDRLHRVAGHHWLFTERTGVSMARTGAPDDAREPAAPPR
jgi:3-phenylpropionate/cinnamic acid dioxygenase small subunit